VLYSLDIPDASLIKQLETKMHNFTSDHGYFDETKPIVMTSEPGQINSSSLVGSSLAENDSSIVS